MSNPVKHRYDFVLLFDVQDGNPNGDPDAGNLPRVDAETGCGLVTDVCLKRKVRNYAMLTKGDVTGFDIFVKEKAILNQAIERAYADLGIDLEKAPEGKKKRNNPGVGQDDEVAKARDQMCHKFFDIRTFGAVMSTGANAGQVRGPVQMTFGRSIDPIVSLEHSITRMAVATEAEAEKQSGDNRTMGRKNTVPYGLYVSHGFVSAHLANQTKFSEDDLKLLWESLVNMFEHDRSAARGLMATQKLVIFKHDNALGSAPAHKLFERVQIKRKDGSKPARSIHDYEILIDDKNLPAGVSIEIRP
ncbi:MAG TPA: type I-C CRISPR-associated protein Cas7/Csd2 [Kiritimatiellia bacterium]|nr:type I-C CRISPR-associated protein Cas7/Csd2 [Kiritimatiellia bacterium]HMP33729.1 type I-C CRISPR-associated protein Cas7/Csd2 [Kiritimatiellia bacterium]